MKHPLPQLLLLLVVQLLFVLQVDGLHHNKLDDDDVDVDDDLLIDQREREGRELAIGFGANSVGKLWRDKRDNKDGKFIVPYYTERSYHTNWDFYRATSKVFLM